MGRLVYYVEDDTSIRELVLYALKTSDFQVMGFEDAASFYQQIKKQLPDLILLDIMLPDVKQVRRWIPHWQRICCPSAHRSRPASEARQHHCRRQRRRQQ